jgi:hypothetical protein
MSDFKRGIVKAMSFEIEYPDGSTKNARIADASHVEATVFHEGYLRSPDDTPRFCVSGSDWRENPAMFVYTRRPDPGKDGWTVVGRGLCHFRACGM